MQLQRHRSTFWNLWQWLCQFNYFELLHWQSEVKGIFRSKFIPWSNTSRHRVRPPPLERSSLQTASLRSFSNLRNGRTITIHCSLWLQQDTAIKKSQIMLRTAPNFSSSRHQTAASLAGLQLTTLLPQLPVVGKSLRVNYQARLELLNSVIFPVRSQQ